MSTSNIRASRSTRAARSAWRRSRPGSRRSCASPPTRRSTSRACSKAARSASLLRTCARRRRHGPWCGRPNFLRSASDRTPAGCRTCISARFRRRRHMPRSTLPPWFIVQFESAATLERADEIIAVDGIDMVLVGLNDLLADWGIPGDYDHPRVREAYAKIIAACRCRGKHCGVGGLATRPDLVAEFVKMGARYVSTGTDLGFLIGACTARASEVKKIKL